MYMYYLIVILIVCFLIGQINNNKMKSIENPLSLFSEEIENLEVQLEARDKSFHALEADHTTTLDEKKKTEGKAQALKKKSQLDQQRVKELESELKAKDELVRAGEVGMMFADHCGITMNMTDK